MSEVKGRGSALAFRLTAGRISNCNWLHRVGDGALRRRSIKLLFAGSAFRVSVSGLVLCLNGGRRAQPGHVYRGLDCADFRGRPSGEGGIIGGFSPIAREINIRLVKFYLLLLIDPDASPGTAPKFASRR